MSTPATPIAETRTPVIDNMRGAVWMLAGVVCFAGTAVVIKQVGQTLHTFEIVFFRCLFGLLVVIPLVMRSGLSVLRIRKPHYHFYRVLFAIVGMSGGFYATANLELATAVSLQFTRPLFMIIIALIVLGETVRWRRGLATAVGFIGVLIVVRPGSTALDPAMAAALIGAASVAGALVMVKLMAPHDDPAAIMTSFSVGTAILAAVPVVFVWQVPTMGELGFLVLLGILASSGQYCLIRAYTFGEATVMNPIDYLQIILVSVAGFFIFGEVPSVWTWMGAVVIVGSTAYIVFREARLKVTRPPDPALPPPR